MFISLDFLYFILVAVPILGLVLNEFKKSFKRDEKISNAYQKNWGLQGYVNSEGDFISRVPGQKV